MAASYKNGNIVIYNVDTQEYIQYFQVSDSHITSIRWKPHLDTQPKNVLLAVGSDGKITHWHTQSGKVLHVLEDKDNPIMCLDYSSDGSKFATAGNDKKVKLYDDSMKDYLNTMKGCSFNRPGHSNRIFSVCFHKKNPNLVASAGWDNTVHFYDVNTCSVVNRISGPHISGDSIDLKDN